MKKNILLPAVFLVLAASGFSQQIKGHYAIKNVQTGMLLRVMEAHSENGTPLVAYGPENWKCMTWEFNTSGANVYQLQNLLTGKTFEPSAKPDAGVTLVEEPISNSTAFQQYEFIKDRGNNYLIRLRGTNLYLAPQDKKGSTNSAIILAARSNSPEQLWEIYAQEPTM